MTGFENVAKENKDEMKNCASFNPDGFKNSIQEKEPINIFNTQAVIQQSRELNEEIQRLGKETSNRIYEMLRQLMDIITAQTERIIDYSETIDSLERDNGELVLEREKYLKELTKYEMDQKIFLVFKPEVPELIIGKERANGRNAIVNIIWGQEAITLYEHLMHG